MQQPDDEGRPSLLRTGTVNESPSQVTHTNFSSVACPLACSPSCSYRCPTTPPDAVRVVVEHLAVTA